MLLDLISSLSGVEKRYISSKFSNKVVLSDLYTYFLKYDDSRNETINKYFSGKYDLNLITTLKNQLYNFILEELVLYNKENILEIELKKEISKIEILFSKKLLSHALKRLKKLKLVCQENERLSHLVECLNLELWISFEHCNSDELEIELKKIYDELKEVQKNIQEQFLYKLSYIYSIHIIDNQANLVHIANFNPERDRKLKLDSSIYYFEHTKLIWCLEMKKFDVAQQAADRLAGMEAIFPNELKKNKAQYTDVMFACALANIFNENYEGAFEFIENIRALKNLTGRTEIRRNERLSYIEVLFKVRQKKFDLETEKENFRLHEDQLNAIFTQRIQLLFCYACIKTFQYKEARKWSNSILFLKNKDMHFENFIKAVYADLYLNLVLEKTDLFEKQVAYAVKKLKQNNSKQDEIDWFKKVLKADKPLTLVAQKIDCLM